MDLEAFRKYCLSKKGVSEGFPFGEDTLVFKVMGKIFAITSFEQPLSVNLKCDPEKAVELRESYEDVQPGYHMNKKHWNTVNFEGEISVRELKEMTDHSYELVVNSLTKKLKEELLRL
ncbi:MAG: MmcQ/YjbR family DNA-binding protein [Ignavibacteria bacterium]|mgnify:CR=1 FL=1|nr:MmcQ/YjbR family DNA-binding protein [Ignavibacteria bacterium]MBK9225548.1 MmcQ/YjbR family DNA-binding protein [Ignavibacteria bacterium]